MTDHISRGESIVESIGRRTAGIIGIGGKNMLLEKTVPEQIISEFFDRAPGMDDLEAVVDLCNAAAVKMSGKVDTRLDEMRSDWTSPTFNIETACRVVVNSEDRLVGYVEVWDTEELPVDVWVWGRVHPDYEDRGIGTFLLQWAEERARQALDRVPDGLQVVMRSGALSTYEPALELLQNNGLTLIRHFYTMTIELDRPPQSPMLPRGITIRTMRGEEELADIIHAKRDAFQDHWGHVEQPFEQEYEEWLHYIRNLDDFDPTLWFLAVEGEEIAGISLCWQKSRMDPNMGWVGILGVRRAWRRKGLGLALLNHSFGEFYRRGKAGAGLGVDAGSLTGALRLYEKAGMERFWRFDLHEKELRPGRTISRQVLDES
jgi:mycothiol synthase